MRIFELTESRNDREHVRLRRHFMTKLAKMGLVRSVEGVSENVSQGGALIKTTSWHVFELHDRAVVTFYLPPRYSGQDRTICLQGIAVITRLEQKKQCLAVRFTKRFKQFQRVDGSELLAR